MEQVKAGDKVTAKGWNEVVSAVKDLQGSGSSSVSRGKLKPDEIWVECSSQRKTGDVVALTSWKHSSDSYDECLAYYKNSGLVFVGSTPSGSAGETIATLVEACPAGGMARAHCPGLFVADVSGNTSYHTRCHSTYSSESLEVIADGATSTSPVYTILFHSPESNNKALCVIVSERYGVYYNGTLYTSLTTPYNSIVSMSGNGKYLSVDALDGFVWKQSNTYNRVTYVQGSGITGSVSDKTLTLSVPLQYHPVTARSATHTYAETRSLSSYSFDTTQFYFNGDIITLVPESVNIVKAKCYKTSSSSWETLTKVKTIKFGDDNNTEMFSCTYTNGTLSDEVAVRVRKPVLKYSTVIPYGKSYVAVKDASGSTIYIYIDLELN